MQQPRMIVLALIGSGLRYGFEMEEFARESQMRQWAKIGMSTIYKLLAQLEREGAVEAEVEESRKGPVRKAYRLTGSGRAELRELLVAALVSNRSVYSDRIAGLVFSPLLPGDLARHTIERSLDALSNVDADLADRLGEREGDAIGSAVLTYYREIYAAERKAMRAILTQLD